MSKMVVLTVIILLLYGCRGRMTFIDRGVKINDAFRITRITSHASGINKKHCLDAIIRDPLRDAWQYDACGFDIPDISSYKVVSKEDLPMPAPFQGKMYLVTFRDRHGDVVIKGYHKTHLTAYIIEAAGEPPHTIVDTTCRDVYDKMYFGRYEIPKCVVELHKKAEIDGYLPGQFEEQEGFIKLRGPEPDDFNPYEDEPFSSGKHWRKACEWWDEDLLEH